MAERAAGGRKVKKPPTARPPKAKRKPATQPRGGAGEAPPEAIAALRADEELTELIDGLALSARFHFYLLVCETPRLTSAILEILASDIPKARGEPARIVCIDPYRGHTPPSAPIPFERLVDEVLARLVALTPEDRKAEVILVVDASRALPQDHDAWMRLFMRLNERRNVIARQLRGPLLLALPGWLEPVFAHAAPDFWSIRSLAVVVEAPASLFPVPLEPLAERLPAPRPQSGPAPDGEATAIAAGIAQIRATLADDPADDSALRALSVLLDRQSKFETEYGSHDRALAAAQESVKFERERLARDPESSTRLRNLLVSLNGIGDMHLARGELERARAAYDESLGLGRRLIERDPERAEALSGLSVSVGRIGDVHLARGELKRALDAYNESLALARRLLERDPERAEGLRNLSVILERIGDMHRDQGELDRALDAYNESLGLRRRLLERDPERAEALRDLSIGLDRVGDVHRARGELERARAAYDESLVLRRRRLERDPERADALSGLSSILTRIGDVHHDQGELERALDAYNESVALARRLLERDPERAEALHVLSISLDRIGDVCRARGELERSREAFNESLGLARRLLAREPEHPSWRHDLAVSLVHQAHIAEASGRPQEALAFWRQASAELDAVARLPSPSRLWVKRAELCRAEIARLEAALAPPKPNPRRPPSVPARDAQGDRPAQNPPKPKRRRA